MNYYAKAITILEKVIVEELPTEETKLLFEVARTNPGALVKAYGQLNKTDESFDRQIIEYAKCGRKIDTIKYCRTLTGEGLREAKKHVEAMVPPELWNSALVTK